MILGIRTDKPEAELYLLSKDGSQIASDTWEANRQLSNDILVHIEALLDEAGVQKNNLTGLAVFKGPGSFTGLRIGISVANTIAYALNAPITGSTGDDWLGNCVQLLGSGKGDKLVLPEYGSAPNITKPRK